jgi:hypothetical protein
MPQKSCPAFVHAHSPAPEPQLLLAPASSPAVVACAPGTEPPPACEQAFMLLPHMLLPQHDAWSPGQQYSLGDGEQVDPVQPVIPLPHWV